MPPSEATRPQWQTLELRMASDKRCAILAFVKKDLRSAIVIKELESELARMVPSLTVRQLVFDFSDVETASSAVFGLMFRDATDPPARVSEVIGLLETLVDAWNTVASKSADGPEANAPVRDAVLVA